MVAMNPIINKTISMILSIIIIGILIFFIKTIKEANKKKNEFIEYLEDKNDYQNLIKFGFYNLNGFKESRRIPLLDKIIFKEYQSNKDKAFLEYSIYIRYSSKKLIFLFLSAFFLFCTVTTIISMDW